MTLVAMTVTACGKSRILQEANAVEALSYMSIDEAEAIIDLSDDPLVDSHAAEIITHQREIVSRAVRIEHATAQIEDKADGYLTWWGDFFIGGVESAKWIAIAIAVGVVAFVGARAKIWTFIGGLLPGRKRETDK